MGFNYFSGPLLNHLSFFQQIAISPKREPMIRVGDVPDPHFHCIIYTSQDNTIELDDGSIWKISSANPESDFSEMIANWTPLYQPNGAPIPIALKITANSSEFSGPEFSLWNTHKNEFIIIELLQKPELNSNAVIRFRYDMAQKRVWLDDQRDVPKREFLGFFDPLSEQDAKTMQKWAENDPIVIGFNQNNYTFIFNYRTGDCVNVLRYIDFDAVN